MATTSRHFGHDHALHLILGGLWLMSLVALFGFSVASLPVSIVFSLAVVGCAIAAYTAAGAAYSRVWKVLMLVMIPLGIFLIAHPFADWRNGVPQTWLPIPAGISIIVTAAWGLWPRRGSAPQPKQA